MFRSIATLVLALVLAGCGHAPVNAPLLAARHIPAASQHAVTVDRLVQDILEKQFPGALVQVYNVESDGPEGTVFRFQAEVQALRGTMTSLIGHYDAVSRQVALDTDSSDFNGGL